MRIFSGIQPTGQKHLGNYIGAIRQYVEGQDRGDPAIYCIVDLHAMTVPFDTAELRANVLDTTAILLAAGLEPDKGRCILFRQSDVREHTELCWLLASVTSIGELNRINLRITAIPGGGLLGDLLCGIANLLNPPAILGNDLAAVLNSLLALVPARPTG